MRNVLYHVASYLGRTDVPLEGFRPQEDEIAGLRYAPRREVDAMLLRGELAPEHGVPLADPRRAALALARA